MSAGHVPNILSTYFVLTYLILVAILGGRDVSYFIDKKAGMEYNKLPSVTGPVLGELNLEFLLCDSNPIPFMDSLEILMGITIMISIFSFRNRSF